MHGDRQKDGTLRMTKRTGREREDKERERREREPGGKRGRGEKEKYLTR